MQQPRLVLLGTGEVYPLPMLPADEFLIGRDEPAFTDPLLSRRHCGITLEDGEYQLQDYGSLNGTRLNGRLLTSRQRLQHGDRIEAGGLEMVFLLKEGDIPAPPEPNPRKLTVLANSNILLASLIEAADSLSKLRDKASIRQKVFSLIFSATPADRAALEVDGAWTFSERDGAAKAFPIKDALQGSVICLPQIYAEVCDDSNSHFDNGHAELLAGIASIAALAFEHAGYIEQLQQDVDVRHEMVGESDAMAELTDLIGKVAPTNSTVLIMGESGTGKELVARAIHRNSKRASGPFVAVNCAALSETLIESQLFGYEKGAFTGAVTRTRGEFELASGGTLFLDEVGELSPAVQAKLLRALQEREIKRLGGSRPVPIDIRVIAATNRDLAKDIAAKTFREDLYYRLNVVSVKTPSLRHRREDIPVLARRFVAKYSREMARPVFGISREALAALMSYHWPGNIRELQNVIERAIVMNSTGTVERQDLGDYIVYGDALPDYEAASKAGKREIVERAMAMAGGRYKVAAEMLGIHPTSLYRILHNFGLKDLLKERTHSATPSSGQQAEFLDLGAE